MTALVKLFRATAFKLTLAILGLSAIGAALVLGVVAWQVIKLVDDETRQTIEAEAAGLSEQYKSAAFAASARSSRRARASPGLRSIS